MRWEYTTFGARVTGADADSEEIRRQLNEHGAEGWELVSVIGTETSFLGTGGTGMVIGVFKRPIPDPAPADA